MKRLKRKPMSRTFTAIAGLAALIALSASAATADENPYSQGGQAACACSDGGGPLGGIAGDSHCRRIRWQGIVAPKNTPTEIVDKLNEEIRAALSDAGFKFMWGLRGSFPVEIEAHITERINPLRLRPTSASAIHPWLPRSTRRMQT